MIRNGWKYLAAGAAIALAAGCASTPSAPTDPWTLRADSATAYMAAHPVEPKPGMYTGIVFAGITGGGGWILEVAARDGEWVEAQCGPKGQPAGSCTWPAAARHLLGAYIYVQSEGCCSTANADHPSDIRVITYRALRLKGMESP